MRSWPRSASPPSGWAWNPRAPTTPSWMALTLSNSPANCASTASCCWAPLLSAWNTIRRRTSRKRSSTPSRMRPLCTPVPGTPLYFEMAGQGRLLAVDLADIHGQHAFNFRHAAISCEQSTSLLNGAFQRDFERNGPSLFRICRTTFAGYMRYKNHPDSRIRERWQRECRTLRHAWVGFIWAMEHRLTRSNPEVAAKI